MARAGAALTLLCAFVLGLTQIEDSDAWTHLALGRELVRLGGFPATEPFAFPAARLPYWNLEWIWQLGLYGAFVAAGTAGVVLLKATLVTAVFWLLWRDSRSHDVEDPDRAVHVSIRVAVLLATLLIVRYRFVERPDLALMLFLAFTIHALNVYLAEGRRLVWALPVVGLLWANTHPSIVVGVAPFAAALGAAVVLRLAARWTSPASPVLDASQAPRLARRLRVIAVVLVGFLLAALVNPHGTDSLTLPFYLAGLEWHYQEIYELQRPLLGATPGPFVIAALLLVTLALRARRLSLTDVLLVAPFVYLGLSTRRFVFLFAIVAAPVLARNLSALVDRWRGRWWRRLALGASLATAAAGVTAVGLSIAQTGWYANPKQVAGLGVNRRFLPEGALRYLDDNGIDGRIFNTFHWGGYIVWRDFPRRVPIVDGRGHMPPGLLEEIHFARAYAGHLDRLQGAYGFEVAVVDYPVYAGENLDEAFGPDADIALTSPRWALVYWDDVALVYVRREGRHAGLAARDGYRHIKPANGPPHLRRVLANRSLAPAVEAELRRAQAKQPSSIASLLLGVAAAERGAFDEAIADFGRVEEGPWRLEAWQGLGLAYWRKGDLARAVEWLRRILDDKETVGVLYNVGVACVAAGNDREAVRYLEIAHRKDRSFTPLYPALIAAYRRLGNREGEIALGQDFLDAVTRERADGLARKGLALLRAGKPAEAATELRAALGVQPTNAKALSYLGYAALAEGRLDDAVTYQRAALTADPRLTQAHHGLALAYRQLGDERRAQRHLEAYARGEPRSYGAWQARLELAHTPR